MIAGITITISYHSIDLIFKKLNVMSCFYSCMQFRSNRYAKKEFLDL